MGDLTLVPVPIYLLVAIAIPGDLPVTIAEADLEAAARAKMGLAAIERSRQVCQQLKTSRRRDRRLVNGRR